MKVLITGFEPFGGQTVNPAYEAVKALPDRIDTAWICKAEIPTAFAEDFAVLERLITQEQPDAVICVGQAGGRSRISLERVAINVMDARIPDNAGCSPQDEPIVPDGPDAYFSRLPIRQMEAAIRDCGIPCAVSNSAGTYVCNDIMYRLLHHMAMKKSPAFGGFIHVPYLPGQAAALPGDAPSMDLAMIRDALAAAIRVLIQNGDA